MVTKARPLCSLPGSLAKTDEALHVATLQIVSDKPASQEAKLAV